MSALRVIESAESHYETEAMGDVRGVAVCPAHGLWAEVERHGGEDGRQGGPFELGVFPFNVSETLSEFLVVFRKPRPECL